MITALAIATVALGIAVVVLALCMAARLGDHQLAQARQDLEDERLGAAAIEHLRAQRLSYPSLDADTELQRILVPHARRAALRVIPGGRDPKNAA